jgi:type I restriction enzyme S subunit
METFQPKLRFPEFKGDWENKKLKEIGSFLGGGTPSTKEEHFWNGEIPWVSSSDITDENIFDIRKTRFITDEAVKKSATKLIPKGNILIVSRVGVGKVVINDEDICTSQDFTNLILNNSNNFFIAYLIKNETNKLLEFNQGTSIKGFVKSDLEELNIIIPSLEEQTKIANFLSSVDEKLNLLKEKKALLEDYKKGIMQKIFNQDSSDSEQAKQIRFKDDNGNDFENWVKKSLGNIAEVNKGNQLNKDDLNDFDVYPSISGGIEPSGYTDKFNRNENTIIISEGGNSCGYVNFIKTKFWCGGHCYSIDILATDNFDNDYLYQLLKFNQNEIMALRVGSGLPNIQKKDLKNFLLKLSINKIEQTKIANFLSAIDEKTALVSNQIQDTQEYKKGLLQQMFV